MATLTFPDFVALSCCNACCPTGVVAQVVDAAAISPCSTTQGCGCGCGCGCDCGCGCGCVRGTQKRVLGTFSGTNACCRGMVDPIWGCRPEPCGCVGANPLNPCCGGWGGFPLYPPFVPTPPAPEPN